MRRRQVIYSSEAEDNLDSIFSYVASEASPNIALRLVERIDRFCLSLEHASERGQRHDDIRSGLRSVGFERRITIVFHVSEETVSVLRIFYAGRNWRDEFDELG